MPISNQLKNQHLLWRAGFGPTPDDYPQLAKSNQKAVLKQLLKDSREAPASIDVADNLLKKLVMGDKEAPPVRQLNAEQRKELNRQSREDLKKLTLAWIDQMADSKQQLREKMSLFWHGHFASRSVNIFYQQQLLDVVREQALGNFGDLLRGISKSASVINFLNNNQNKKNHPNENFAREVMELFTMGRGNYTENDVKEAARAFTGWGANQNGEFVFRQKQHDTGSKTFLGKTGNFDGDDILNIILENKQTARFIAGKIYRYFVNEVPNQDHINALGDHFYQSQYNLESLMEQVFSAEWFYDEKNIGSRIKSPIELIVGIRRNLPMDIKNPEIQILLQRLLGQLLFYPPNVAGWPGGLNWIDSSSLMLRMRIPQMIYEEEEVKLKPKDNDDQMMGLKEKPIMSAKGKKGGQVIETDINWEAFMQDFAKVSRTDLATNISTALLQTPARIPDEVLNKYSDASSREAYIKTITIQLMSTPEYQLC